MIDVQVTIPGEAKWQAAMADLSKASYFDPARRSLLEQAGERVKERAREIVPAKFGILRGAIGYEVENDRVRIGVIRDATGDSGTSAREYGHYIAQGRSQGTMPPPAVLRGWIAKSGFTGSEFVLRRSLARKPSRPQPFLEPALEQKKTEIVGLARIAYQNALNAFANRVGGGILGRVGAFFRGFFG